jgi:hypothetical protein
MLVRFSAAVLLLEPIGHRRRGHPTRFPPTVPGEAGTVGFFRSPDAASLSPWSAVAASRADPSVVGNGRRPDGDRGEPRGSSPPTPPGIRVRTTAVRSSSAVGGVTRRSPGFGYLASPGVIRSLPDRHPRRHPDPPSGRPVATGLSAACHPRVTSPTHPPDRSGLRPLVPGRASPGRFSPLGRVSRSSGPTASAYYALC